MTPKERKTMELRKAKRDAAAEVRERIGRKAIAHVRALENMLDEEWIQPALDQDGNVIVTAAGPVIVNRTAEMVGKAKIRNDMLKKVVNDMPASAEPARSSADALDAVFEEIANRPVYQGAQVGPSPDRQDVAPPGQKKLGQSGTLGAVDNAESEPEKGPGNIALPGPESVN